MLAGNRIGFYCVVLYSLYDSQKAIFGLNKSMTDYGFAGKVRNEDFAKLQESTEAKQVDTKAGKQTENKTGNMVVS
ncbi:MAG: hypothetical protein V4628_12120 [Pseudomonadota bacterium]